MSGTVLIATRRWWRQAKLLGPESLAVTGTECSLVVSGSEAVGRSYARSTRQFFKHVLGRPDGNGMAEHRLLG